MGEGSGDVPFLVDDKDHTTLSTVYHGVVVFIGGHI